MPLIERLYAPEGTVEVSPHFGHVGLGILPPAAAALTAILAAGIGPLILGHRHGWQNLNAKNEAICRRRAGRGRLAPAHPPSFKKHSKHILFTSNLLRVPLTRGYLASFSLHVP